MKMTNELKTGAVVIAAILVGVIFWYKTTDFSAKPYRLTTFFNYADGIKPNSIVKLAGVDVGRVEKIEFSYDPETKVELTLLLDVTAKPREDSIAFISTSGIVGDTYIGLTPGSAGKAFVKEGAVVVSEDPIDMRNLMKKAQGIADNLDKALIEVRKLAENVNGVVTDNKVKVDNIATNLEATTSNFKDFSQDIKQHPWKLLMKGK
ncbi:MAG: MlaD family protein [Candidatus Omnitrophota bacterium]|jgi:ABC-type transporter Mla subunit MlaD